MKAAWQEEEKDDDEQEEHLPPSYELEHSAVRLPVRSRQPCHRDTEGLTDTSK